MDIQGLEVIMFARECHYSLLCGILRTDQHKVCKLIIHILTRTYLKILKNALAIPRPPSMMSIPIEMRYCNLLPILYLHTGSNQILEAVNALE